MGVVIDLITRRPVEIWLIENAKASDTKFEVDILAIESLDREKDRGDYYNGYMTIEDMLTRTNDLLQI